MHQVNKKLSFERRFEVPSAQLLSASKPSTSILLMEEMFSGMLSNVSVEPHTESLEACILK